MIRYALRCAEGHDFESWFQSAAAFDRLHGAGHVACEVCGNPEVTKTLMAPRVKTARGAARSGAEAAAPADQPMAAGPLSQPGSKVEAALAEFRRKLEENSTYVGRDFAREARQMHLGEVPERQIHGEASASEAKALVEDGIPVLPLPGPPRSKTN